MSHKHTLVQLRVGGMFFFASTVLHPIFGVQGRHWQVDYRPDGWLPFSVRNGNRKWHIIPLGPLGALTVGRVSR